MTAPERSLAQRMSALANANATRTARKALKAVLKRDAYLDVLIDVIANPQSAGVHIDDPPPFDWTSSWKLSELLVSAHHVGPWKARKLLEHRRISPSKTIGGLSPRQRDELLLELAAARINREHVHPRHQETIAA